MAKDSDKTSGETETDTDASTTEFQLKALLSVCKRNHTRAANNLKKAVAGTNAAEPFYVQNALASCSEFLLKLDEAHVNYLTFLEGEDDNGETDANHSLQLELEAKVAEFLVKKGQTKTQEKSSPAEKVIQPQPRLKVPDLPPFENTIRAYPKFKADFRNHYEKHYGSHAAMVLKNNLLKDFPKNLCSACQTVDEIFSVLDSIYGDEGKLVETIMADLEKTKSCRDGNVEDLRLLRYAISLAESDLRGIFLEKHIDQYQTVMLIKRKLSITAQRGWAEKVAREKISTADRYKKMKDFLDLEIRTLDLMPSNFQQQPQVQPDSDGTKHKSGSTKTGQGEPQRDKPGSSKSSQGQGDPQPPRDSGEVKCPLHPTMRGHFFSQCNSLRKKSTDEKVKIMENEAKNFCRCCLRSGHKSEKCEVKVLPCRNEGCTRKHFTFMHHACEKLRPRGAPQNSYRASANNENEQTVPSISPAQFVNVQTRDGVQQLRQLWDQGSNLTLIKKEVCQRAGFEIIDEPSTNLSIERVGSDKISEKSFRCKIPLLNCSNELVETVVAYAIESIGFLNRVDLSETFKIFDVPPEQQEGMKFPDGEIEILLGTDNAQLILRPVAETNGLRLDESELGQVIYGRHPSFAGNGQRAYMVVAQAKIPTPANRSKTHDAAIDAEVKSLFSTESMGISCVPRCGRCGCGKCTLESGWSLQEKFEYEQIRSNMTIEDGVITTSYPYCKDLSTLPDNEPCATKRLQQLERGLKKNPALAEKFEEQFQDMIIRGKMRLLTPDEENQWNGKVQYLPMNYVLKESSTSTPLRIIFDPSSRYLGQAMNDYWGRGPNLVRDIFGILIRFCEFQTTLFADIRKMYQTVMTTPTEWHLHRVLWRSLEDRKPDKYVIICNSFGDGPAGTVAIAAIHFLADLAVEELGLHAAAKTLRTSTYVDDILDSTTSPEEAKQRASEIDQILARGGFEVKKWSFVDNNSVEPEEIIIPLGGKSESVLGMNYDLSSDQFFFRIRLNFSKKHRGARVGRDLQKDEIFDKQKVPQLTKRNVMAQTHTIYDPMGKLQPFIVEIKFALGKLYRFKDESNNPLGWDDPIPEEYDETWRLILNKFFEIENLRFPRRLSSANAVGDPIVIVFSDSSMLAYGACLYVHWNLADGQYYSRLVTAKSRMWPIDPDDYLSVCRGELQAAVMAKKIAVSFLEATRFKVQETIFVLDSEIVLAQINMDSHYFSVFVGHRIAEIRSAFPPQMWWFTRSENNPCADLLSRGTQNVTELDLDSTWQTGPAWLKTNRATWPIWQNVKTKEPIPELRSPESTSTRRTMMIQVHEVRELPFPTSLESRISFMIQTTGEPNDDDVMQEIPRLPRLAEVREEAIARMIDLSRHDELQFWLAVTFRILNILSWRKGDGLFFQRIVEPTVITAEQRDFAKLFWLKQAQKPLVKQIKAGRFKTLTPFVDSDGLYRCNARAINTTGGYHPVLLPHDHRISRLIVVMYHRRGHHGATSTAAKTRAEYHILRLRHLATTVRNQCQLCRLTEKRLMKAPMGSLPPNRLQPAAPFEHSSCDIFGPFQIELTGRVTRSKKTDPAYTKGYGLIITCMVSRAIHIEAMHGQNTDSFLQAFRRFASIRGQPKSMYSDCGGQLIAADEELKAMTEEFDMEKIQQFGAKNGITWTYSSPGSPWQNGVSESLIKSVKQTLKTIIDKKKMPILELQTVFYEVADILNDRPISLGHQGASGNDSQAEDTYLCPNQILLRKGSGRHPHGPSSCEDQVHTNDNFVTNFWIKWTELYLPTLIYQSKWHAYQDAPKVNDIVYVRDLNPIRGNWNIAEIVEVPNTESRTPINVRLRYKRPGTSMDYQSVPNKFQWRDVRNLVKIMDATERSELNPKAPAFRMNSEQK